MQIKLVRNLILTCHYVLLLYWWISRHKSLSDNWVGKPGLASLNNYDCAQLKEKRNRYNVRIGEPEGDRKNGRKW